MSAATGLELAQSSSRVRALADNEQAPISRDDVHILAASPWPKHQYDAGWICMQLYTNYLALGKRKTDLIGTARKSWQSVVSNPYSKGVDRLHAEFARSHSGLWVRAAECKTGWTSRSDRLYTVALIGLSAVMMSEDGRALLPSEGNDTAGALAEIVVAMALNNHSLLSGSDTVTIPAQSWNDNRHEQSSANFDLWQVTDKQWRKIQVKSTPKALSLSGEYDPDIAVVVLSDHLHDRFRRGIERFSARDMSDQEILELGESIQSTVNSHFQTL